MLDDPDRQLLLTLARDTVAQGLEQEHPTLPDLHGYAGRLIEPAASFVSLYRGGALRGCIGTLTALRPLVQDVAHNAFAAAFRDPRFAPLARAELDGLAVRIAVLTRPEPLSFADEAELLALLRPGIDGVVLEDRGRRGTFLPAVWATLPEPEAFLYHLKAKAGFAPHYWSDTLQVQRYTVEEFGSLTAD